MRRSSIADARVAFVLVAALAAASPWLGGCAVPQPDVDFPHVLESEPATGANYWIYVPQGYRDWKPSPLIVTCHGTIPFDTANMHIREWKALADENNCIVIAPELPGTDGILGDGPVHAMIEAEKRIMAIVSEVAYQYNIDRANVMITGFSGGGFPMYFVGLRHPDVFTVIAARNCNFSEHNISGRYPIQARNNPVLVYWGSVDPGPIIGQSENAVRYLRESGFHVASRVIEGVGHERHPEVAMGFFLSHRKAAVASLPTKGYRVTRPSARTEFRPLPAYPYGDVRAGN
ncbi:MAG: hypothetical protein LLG01_15415 [Planctomycetaceae bacterium]|nr:hypothetical protein [Planctomycetaceae bacterium]